LSYSPFSSFDAVILALTMMVLHAGFSGYFSVQIAQLGKDKIYSEGAKHNGQLEFEHRIV
jgi:hypothetical protein